MITTVRIVLRWMQFSSPVFLLFWLAGCGSSGKEPTPPVTATPDVYVAGWDTIGTFLKPVYWKNGVETVLDTGSYGGRAEGIAVANGNVYVVGFEGSSAGNDVAVVWVNGTPMPLQSDSHQSVAWAIAVSGADVYIAGSDAPTGTSPSAAVYWKNGVETTLSVSGLASTTSYEGASASAIALDSDNNLYVGGTIGIDSEVTSTSYFGTSAAGYWKNGSFTLLGNPLSFSQVYGIAVSDGSVYVSGNACAATFSDNNFPPDCSVATYWLNGEATMQSPASNSSYDGIAVAGSNLYLPDNVTDSGLLSAGNLAELSTNGTLVQLSTSTEAAANCVFAYNSDVYVGGAANNTAGYWKNGTAVALPESGTQSTVIAIDVVPAGTAAD